MLWGPEDYRRWQKLMILSLKSMDLWKYVTAEVTESTTWEETYQKEDSRATLHILCNLSEPIRDTIDTNKTSHEIWEQLKSAYEGGPALRETCWREWNNMRYDGWETIEEFCHRFQSAFENVRGFGLKFLSSDGVEELKVFGFLLAIEDRFKLFVDIKRQQLRNNTELKFEHLMRDVISTARLDAQQTREKWEKDQKKRMAECKDEKNSHCGWGCVNIGDDEAYDVKSEGSEVDFDKEDAGTWVSRSSFQTASMC